MGDINEQVLANNNVALILLDSSSAFDTVDHGILLSKLEQEYNIRNKALALIKSYLEQRTFSVTVNGEVSSEKPLQYGVPQGSLLGPLLYIMYIRELEDLLTSLGVKFHFYADDCALYLSFNQINNSEAQTNLNTCLAKINNWMTNNFQKLNTEKTKLQIFKPNSPSLEINIKFHDQTINCNDQVCLLGVKLGNTINFGPFISQKVQSCHFHLRNLFNIRNCLPIHSRIILVTNMILSKLDYCNSILICSNKKSLHPLQLILNRAIRFIFNLKRRTHIKPFLKKLHILPIDFRIRFKVCLFGFKIVNKISPQYLTDVFPLFRSTSNMPLRIATGGRDELMFEVKLQKKDSIYYKIKSEWNRLPYETRQITSISLFKSKLKTLFFNEAFSNTDDV